MFEKIIQISQISEITWLIMAGQKILICFLGIIIGALLIKFSRVFVHKTMEASRGISERKRRTLSTIFESIAKYLIYFFVICHILSVFGINVTSIIAVASVGSVAIAFGAQSIVQDLLTGVFILMEDQFGVGDIIDIGGLSGTVESISIRTTRVRSADGNLYIIPNGQIKTLTNMSKGFNRAVIDIGIAYEEDADHVMNVMRDELKKIYDNKMITGIMEEPEVLGIVDLAPSSVDIRISARAEIGANWAIERELRRLLKKRLDKENISIPYQQTVVHFANKVKED